MQDISIHKFSYWVKLSFAIICFPCGFWVGGGWGLFQGGGHLQPCGRVLYSIYGHHRGCLNNPCWARFMCHHELWPTSVSHPFSFLNSSLGLTGGKHYQKITIPIFRLVLQNFATPGYFPYILFYSYLFSLLSSGWFVIAVWDCFSQGTS